MMIDEQAIGYGEEQNPLAAAEVPIVDALSGPWVIQKVRALGELNSAAGKMLEEALDNGQLPEEISRHLYSEFGLRLSVLEVARYGAWLPHLRRHALLRAQQQSEQLVAEARKRIEEERR
jgi:hypothetical protein